ncbi:MAG: hypothetical protein AABN34_21305, partial [Acidobacteriota bacterium]
IRPRSYELPPEGGTTNLRSEFRYRRKGVILLPRELGRFPTRSNKEKTRESDSKKSRTHH